MWAWNRRPERRCVDLWPAEAASLVQRVIFVALHRLHLHRVVVVRQQSVLLPRAGPLQPVDTMQPQWDLGMAFGVTVIHSQWSDRKWNGGTVSFHWWQINFDYSVNLMMKESLKHQEHEEWTVCSIANRREIIKLQDFEWSLVRHLLTYRRKAGRLLVSFLLIIHSMRNKPQGGGGGREMQQKERVLKIQKTTWITSTYSKGLWGGGSGKSLDSWMDFGLETPFVAAQTSWKLNLFL